MGEICSHAIPNLVQVIPKDTRQDLSPLGESIEVELNNDFSARVGGKNSTWTMIFDQSMVVELPDDSGRFIANFKYTIKPDNDTPVE